MQIAKKMGKRGQLRAIAGGVYGFGRVARCIIPVKPEIKGTVDSVDLPSKLKCCGSRITRVTKNAIFLT